jgi:hypothetical protein
MDGFVGCCLSGCHNWGHHPVDWDIQANGVGFQKARKVNAMVDAKLSEQLLKDAGYTICHGAFGYDRLYQKRMPKGYFLNIKAYRFPDRIGIVLQPSAQFILPNGDESRFNIDLLADWDLAAVERFFDDIFDRMGCLADDD